MNAEQNNTFWAFIRGDIDTKTFEKWVYAQDALPFPDESFNFELLSLDYSDRNAVYDLRLRLETRMRPLIACECMSVRDEDIIPMGMDGRDKRFFASVEEIKCHSEALWWLSLNKCNVCQQHWLIAQEERIFDDYIVHRIAPETARHIIEQNKWPAIYLTYEDVLKTATALNRHCWFIDPMAGSLVDTAHDLKRNRPDISHDEMATLMGITTEHVAALLKAMPK